MKKILSLLLSKEVLLYIFFGLLTTAVNFLLYHKLLEINTEYHVANVIAWVVSVVFAFIVNKLFVFTSKKMDASTWKKEFFPFLAARFLSLIFELIFLQIGVEYIHLSKMYAKAIAAIFVIIANYLFSKIFIFKKSGE
ncbi:membrane protein, GtrA family [Clostridia bacterium]|nr:membrane protein, GtrA family [Clostridia bacterium]